VTICRKPPTAAKSVNPPPIAEASAAPVSDTAPVPAAEKAEKPADECGNMAA
jgi:hypothetical protein